MHQMLSVAGNQKLLCLGSRPCWRSWRELWHWPWELACMLTEMAIKPWSSHPTSISHCEQIHPMIDKVLPGFHFAINLCLWWPAVEHLVQHCQKEDPIRKTGRATTDIPPMKRANRYAHIRSGDIPQAWSPLPQQKTSCSGWNIASEKARRRQELSSAISRERSDHDLCYYDHAKF